MSSSRRTTGEINILAMLDGQAPGRRILALPAVFWYGAAGVLTCSLLAVLAWLVRGTTPDRDAETANAAAPAVQTAAPPLRPTPATRAPGDARDNLPVTLPSMRSTLAEQAQMRASAPPAAPDTYAPPARGAVIVDLPPAPAAAALPTATVSTMPDHASGVPAATRPQPAASRHAIAHAATPATPSARPQPVYRALPAQAPSLAHAQPTLPRPKRTAGAGAARTPASATVDTDVALISAILQHTGAHDDAAEGTAAAACADKPCGTRLPSRQ